MLPVILSCTDRGDGTSAVVVSAAPGRRVNLVVTNVLLQATDRGVTLASLIQLTERKGTP